MAYTASQLVNMGYGGYQGWDDAGANADFNATGGAGKKTSSGSSSTSSALDPTQTFNNALDQAKQIQQFNVTSAAPEISTLQSNQSNLDAQYKSLLSSITGDQTLAVNNTTKATNATMAARGLSTQDPMAQTNLATAQSAAAQPYSSLYAQTGVQQAQDENAIASQIASLQAGNPEQAISAATGIGGLTAQLGQVGVSQQQANYVPIPGYGVYNVQTGSLLGGLSSTGISPSGNQITGVY